ncbi:MAG: sugar phosphate isomerase/epimerase family protein [Candidatus Caldatribacteriaceae bacterium]
MIKLSLGVKSDPITYRYSFDWLFKLMQEEGVFYLQLGTFLELYFLPDEFFLKLREKAEKRGIYIKSVFSACRELGGFLSLSPLQEEVTFRNYLRLMKVASLVGASSCGASMGAIPRDQMERRTERIENYLRRAKELLHRAHDLGIVCLTLEPMSCYAEPPCSSQEVAWIGSTLSEYHRSHPEDTACFGFCADVSHGWANQRGEVLEDHLSYFVSTFPYLFEFHFKNTDSIFQETFGFEPENIPRGVVDVAKVRALLLEKEELIPHKHLIGYLELPGPKLGRDYSDFLLERMLRESLRYLKEHFPTEG